MPRKRKWKTPEALAELVSGEERDRTPWVAIEARGKMIAARRLAGVKTWRKDQRREILRRRALRGETGPDLPRRGLLNEEKQIGHAAGWRVLWERMAPGVWYGIGDLAALMPEYARRSIHAWVGDAKAKRRGMIEKALNPEWTGSGQDRIEAVPRYLFRRVEEKPA